MHKDGINGRRLQDSPLQIECTMTGVVTVSVIFALVTGTAAGLLSLLTWEILRRSPFGRAVFVLSLAMVGFTLYHVVVIIFPNTPEIAHLFKSVTITGVTLFIGMMVLIQRRMKRGILAGVDN